MMTAPEIIAYAGLALELYNGLKAAAIAQGMTPAEFDASAEAESRRVAKWKEKAIAEQDAVFTSAKPADPSGHE